jgi:hypothetical protein
LGKIAIKHEKQVAVATAVSESFLLRFAGGEAQQHGPFWSRYRLASIAAFASSAGVQSGTCAAFSRLNLPRLNLSRYCLSLNRTDYEGENKK